MQRSIVDHIIDDLAPERSNNHPKREAAVTTTDTPETETDPANEPNTPDPDADAETAKQLEHWKEVARKNEQRAKDNAQKAKDYDALKKSTMSETEKAVAEAKAEGLAEGLKTGSSKIAQAEIRAALAGRHSDPDAFIEGVDAARFIGDDGEVDRAQITAWVDKVAPVGEQKPPVLDLGQGNRGGHGAGDPAQDFAKFIQGQKR